MVRSAGKTCAGISIIENSINIIQKFNKKAYLILPARVESNFKKEIFNIEKFLKNPNKNTQCTSNIYSSQLDQSMDRKQIESISKKLIKNKYKILHYGTFSTYVENEIKKPGNIMYGVDGYKKSINKAFSNTIILIDEVHNIRESNIQGENGDKKIRSILKEIITYSQNLKLVFMSATPMYNSAHEIVFLLNLLILNDIPFELRTNQEILDEKLIKESDVFKEINNEYKLTANGAEIIRKKSLGYVSYLRGENPYTFPKKLDPIDSKVVVREYDPKDRKIEPIQFLKLIECPMHEIQYNLYKKLSENDILSQNEETDPMSSKAIQNSNITYPDEKLEINSIIKTVNIQTVGSGKSKVKTKYVYKKTLMKDFLVYKILENIHLRLTE